MPAIAVIRNAVFIQVMMAICSVPVIGASQAPGTISMRGDGGNCAAKSIGELPVATLDNVPFVTLSANGRPVTLVLDTGAQRTVFTPAVAERVGARAPKVEFQRQIRGIAGTLPTREVELQSFAAGGLPIPWRRVVVAQVTTATILTAPFDGMLGADVLSGFDIDVDLPHQRMLFYEKRACVSAPPWAGPYIAISTGQSRGEHLFFPVTLDGQRLSAIIDTGAQRTTVAKAAAHALGITDTLLEQDRPITTRGAAAEQLGSRIHQFKQLQVGAEVIPHPQLVVSDLKLQEAEIILGVDFIRSRRIFISHASLEIFLSKSK